MESPKQDLEDLMFGAEFRNGVRQAIKEAVAKADAMGLVPAYKPAISKLVEGSDTHKESGQGAVGAAASSSDGKRREEPEKSRLSPKGVRSFK